MDRSFYINTLYPLQDRALRAITGAGTGFYLSGGTAASRGYLQHRFSDDLDLFVNDSGSFGLWTRQLIQALGGVTDCELKVLDLQERFVRLRLVSADIFLKIESSETIMNSDFADVGGNIIDQFDLKKDVR